jgi:hypothetical protein
MNNSIMDKVMTGTAQPSPNRGGGNGRTGGKSRKSSSKIS